MTWHTGLGHVYHVVLPYLIFFEKTSLPEIPAQRLASQHPIQHRTFTQCCFNVGHRLRRWPNIETALGECLVFAAIIGWFIAASNRNCCPYHIDDDSVLSQRRRRSSNTKSTLDQYMMHTLYFCRRNTLIGWDPIHPNQTRFDRHFFAVRRDAKV